MNYQNEQRAPIDVKIEQNLATLSTWNSSFNNTANSKEINMVSWNGRQPQLDIRIWYTDESNQKKPSKGITLNENEARLLYDVLVKLGYNNAPAQ